MSDKLRDKEKNFVSGTVYLYNSGEEIEHFAKLLIQTFEDNFEHSEIIFVNDCSTDDSAEIVKKLSSLAVTTSLSLLNMSYFQGRETAMNAGLDMTIGDFVFEFDSTFVDYTDQEIMDIYDQALSGFDIVILMKEHAFYYTYDRMKFIFILSFLICELSHCLLSNAKEKRYEQVLLFLVTILVCGLNFDTYKKNESYIWETDYRNDNLILAEYISENYSDSILATESRGAVRGYINTLFDRGIYEGTGQYELDAMAVSKGKRYSVMIDLESADALENWCLFKIDKAVICDTETDRITEISVLDGDIKSVEKQYCYTKEYRLADITDENWTYGCSNSEDLLLFYREDDLLVECLTNESVVCGGEMYQIESVDFDDDWIRVSIDHNADICRYPSKLRFVKVKNKETE